VCLLGYQPLSIPLRIIYLSGLKVSLVRRKYWMPHHYPTRFEGGILRYRVHIKWRDIGVCVPSGHSLTSFGYLRSSSTISISISMFMFGKNGMVSLMFGIILESWYCLMCIPCVVGC
jgi:hypothetical protein